MTAPQQSTGKASVRANNPAGDAGTRHAYVENGTIRLLQFGRVEPVSRWDAVSVLLDLEGSPFPSTQERARQIRAALKESMQ